MLISLQHNSVVFGRVPFHCLQNTTQSCWRDPQAVWCVASCTIKLSCSSCGHSMWHAPPGGSEGGGVNKHSHTRETVAHPLRRHALTQPAWLLPSTKWPLVPNSQWPINLSCGMAPMAPQTRVLSRCLVETCALYCCCQQCNTVVLLCIAVLLSIVLPLEGSHSVSSSRHQHVPWVVQWLSIPLHCMTLTSADSWAPRACRL